MTSMLRPALVSFAGLALLTGIAYPLALTGAATLCFPDQARGSLLVRDGQLRGSALIAQPTLDPRYFWGRLSATGDFPGNAAASGAANRSGANPALRAAAQARLQLLRAADPGNADPVPLDLVTSSASGLDPHISPLAASYQATRVAQARHLPLARVLTRIAECTEARQFGLLGEPRVNVLRLNLALDTVP